MVFDWGLTKCTHCIVPNESREVDRVQQGPDYQLTLCALKVIPVVPTVFTNGNIYNAISTNGTIGKNRRYHWVVEGFRQGLTKSMQFIVTSDRRFLKLRDLSKSMHCIVPMTKGSRAFSSGSD